MSKDLLVGQNQGCWWAIVGWAVGDSIGGWAVGGSIVEWAVEGSIGGWAVGSAIATYRIQCYPKLGFCYPSGYGSPVFGYLVIRIPQIFIQSDKII